MVSLVLTLNREVRVSFDEEVAFGKTVELEQLRLDLLAFPRHLCSSKSCV